MKVMRRWLRVWVTISCSLATISTARADPEPPSVLAGIGGIYASIDSLYQDLHRNPELSLHEERTAAKLAARLRGLGYEITEHVGGTGVVAVLRNGAGPTVLVRTEMDALPLKEQTGLPYASSVTVTAAAGDVVPVMHACGHDVHMASWVGAATLLAHARDRWHGTVVFVGQPAEELVAGAAAMIEAGLFTRFPKPDFIVAQHDTQLLPAGQVGVLAGPASAASSSVDITFHGQGGHGAAPQRTVDPVVMAARAVVALQTIVAREVNPFDPAVITVGSFHAGNKRNIIPDEARLELTVRSFKPEVQRQLLAAIERIARAEAAAARAPREPSVVVVDKESTEVVVNDPALAARLSAALRRGLGDAAVVDLTEPSMTGDDFGLYARAAGVPSVLLRIGAIDPADFARARAAGTTMPGPHSPKFAPDRERTLRTGMAVLTVAVLDLLAAR
jgi:hippurate hydrolase